MAAPTQILKALFFFEDQKYGWSEAYYCPQTVAGTPDLGTFLLRAIRLANLRMKLLGVGPKLNYVRVSDDLVRGDSLIATGQAQALPFLPNVVGATKFGTPEGLNVTPNLASGALPADNPYSAVLVRMISRDGKLRSMHALSGVADDYILNQALALSAAWTGAFQEFATQLAGTADNPGIWGAKVLDNSVPQANILAVDVDPGFPAIVGPPGAPAIPSTGYIRVTLDTTLAALLTNLKAPVVSPCDFKVVIHKTRMYPGSVKINRTWQVIPWADPRAPDLGAAMLATKQILLVQSHGPVNFMCGGYVQPVQWNVYPIGGVFIERPCHRKRGRPRFTPRGRRPARRTA